MKEKIERLVIAACIGAIVACVLSWVIFFPLDTTPKTEEISVPETHPFGCPENPSPHGSHT